MSRKPLALARTTALAVSAVSAREPLDRAATDAAIRCTVRSHGGVRGCMAVLAQQYGDHPEVAAPRMRWARQRIAELYLTADPEPSDRAVPSRPGPHQIMCGCDQQVPSRVPGDWPIDRLIAA